MKCLTIFLSVFFISIGIAIADDIEVEVTLPLKHNDCMDGYIDLQINGGCAPYDVKYELLLEIGDILAWYTIKELTVDSTDGAEEDKSIADLEFVFP